jgi:hypothetical protein
MSRLDALVQQPNSSTTLGFGMAFQVKAPEEAFEDEAEALLEWPTSRNARVPDVRS